MSPWRFSLVSMVACGARTPLDDGGGGAGSGGSTATDVGSSSRSAVQTGASTGMSPGGACPGFRLVDPVVVADTQGPAQGLAAMPLAGGNVLLAWRRGRELEASEVSPFAAWPTGLATVVPLAADVDNFSLGNGPRGVVSHVAFGSGVGWVADPFWPIVVATEVPSDVGAVSRAIGAVASTFLYADGYEFGGMSFSSLVGGVVTEADPFVCTSRPLAAIAPRGQEMFGVAGNLADFDFCDTGKAWPDQIVVSRYELGPVGGDPLVVRDTARRTLAEPLVNLAITLRASGAWIVYRTDGSTAFVEPPIVAARIGAHAEWLDGSEVDVGAEGTPLGSVAAVAMGDALAVAYVAVEPSHTAVVVQRIEADGELGPAIAVPTELPGYTGNVRLVASPSNDALLVAWEGRDLSVGMARVDCTL